MALSVGDRVTVEGYSCQGTVMFVGPHHEKGGKRVGVALDEPLGKSRGKFNDHQYFKCKAKCGVLVGPSKVKAAPQETVVFDTDAKAEERLDTKIGEFTNKDIGSKVTVKEVEGEGTLRFIGLHHENGKPRCGVEMEGPVGKTNGTFKGHEYFVCKEGHGLLLPPSKVQLKATKRASLKKKKSVKAKEAPPQPEAVAPAAVLLDYDSMGKLKVIKLLRERKVEYKHLKDIDDLRQLARDTDPDNVAAETPVPKESTTSAGSWEMVRDEVSPSDTMPVVAEDTSDKKEDDSQLERQDSGWEIVDKSKEVESNDGGDSGAAVIDAIAAEQEEQDRQKKEEEDRQAQEEREAEAEARRKEEKELEKARAERAAAAEKKRQEDEARAKLDKVFAEEQKKIAKRREKAAADAQRTAQELEAMFAVTPPRVGPPKLNPPHLYAALLDNKAFDSSRRHDNDLYSAEYARFDSDSGWVAHKATENPYLQIDLGDLAYVARIITKGVRDSDHFSQTFTLQHSVNGINFNSVLDENGVVAEFKANHGTEDLAIVDLPQPVATKFLRIFPKNESSQEPGLRVDLYARPIGQPIGLSSGSFPGDKITTSSDKLATLTGEACRLLHPRSPELEAEGVPGAWQAADTDKAPWIACYLGQQPLHLVSAVAVQGRATGKGQWVQTFNIEVKDGFLDKWVPVLNALGDAATYTANTDKDSATVVVLEAPVLAQHVRIRPLKWHNSCSLRMEIFSRRLGQLSGTLDGSLPDTSFSASSSYRDDTLPHHGRLNSDVGWVCFNNIAPEWLQVDLGDYKLVHGVVTQGRGSGFDQWVDKFEIWTSLDGEKFTQHSGLSKDGTTTTGTTFPGNCDRSTHVVNLIHPSAVARYVRFVATSWYRRAAMRVEVFAEDIGKPLGLSGDDVIVPDDAITCSAIEAVGESLPTNGRLNYTGEFGAWCAEESAQNKAQFLQVDLGTDHDITAILLQGKHGSVEKLLSFRLELSEDGENWRKHSQDTYVKVFEKDKAAQIPVDEVCAYAVEAPCAARFVRICPVTWYEAIALRCELLGKPLRKRQSRYSQENVVETEEAEESTTNPWGVVLSNSGDLDTVTSAGELGVYATQGYKRGHARRNSGSYGFE
eukprot:m.3144 g.3144  ORF g.3144 m.3144 type:complete len:1119 (-) comp2692_c0_seq1:126-3482(-)